MTTTDHEPSSTVRALAKQALRAEFTPFVTPPHLIETLAVLAVAPAYTARARASRVLSEMKDEYREPFTRAVRALIGVEA